MGIDSFRLKSRLGRKRPLNLTGLNMLHIRHDDGCMALLTQCLEDCICQPEVEIQENCTPEEMAKMTIETYEMQQELLKKKRM